jgi:site-specific recombinase XerD
MHLLAGRSRGGEATVPLGKDACALISRYLAQERPNAGIAEPLGKAHGIPNLHPHALRHACAVELPKRTNDLVAVQQHIMKLGW